MGFAILFIKGTESVAVCVVYSIRNVKVIIVHCDCFYRYAKSETAQFWNVQATKTQLRLPFYWKGKMFDKLIQRIGIENAF